RHHFTASPLYPAFHLAILLVFLSSIIRPPPRSTLFPTRRSSDLSRLSRNRRTASTSGPTRTLTSSATNSARRPPGSPSAPPSTRSEEHTSELQSRENLVCRLLLEKKNKTTVLIGLTNAKTHARCR